jgi:hypothetical protein
MPELEFAPMIPVSGREKTFHALDRTVIGTIFLASIYFIPKITNVANMKTSKYCRFRGDVRIRWSPPDCDQQSFVWDRTVIYLYHNRSFLRHEATKKLSFRPGGRPPDGRTQSFSLFSKICFCLELWCNNRLEVRLCVFVWSVYFTL